ncbi:hypothetical protein SAMN05421833_109118 [Microbispora rosea]|uniref:Uncharacterized protein n=1 Tax=Microbispora rosea TaxID=58117 RepID=A0A1N7B3N2_9ACTN|nr:hypothetical protein SAMN05421833_109118 [Microbispora rosea]
MFRILPHVSKGRLGVRLLTSCLQTGLTIRAYGRDLGDRQPVSGREFPLLTALNGTAIMPSTCCGKSMHNLSLSL